MVLIKWIETLHSITRVDIPRCVPRFLCKLFIIVETQNNEKIKNDVGKKSLELLGLLLEDFRESQVRSLELDKEIVVQLSKFLKELDEGYFIQYTADTLLLDVDGRQLLCEAVYLTGTMLLQLDRRIPGYIRERLVIAYYRYCNSDSSSTTDDIDLVCKLVRAWLQLGPPADSPATADALTPRVVASGPSSVAVVFVGAAVAVRSCCRNRCRGRCRRACRN